MVDIGGAVEQRHAGCLLDGAGDRSTTSVRRPSLKFGTHSTSFAMPGSAYPRGGPRVPGEGEPRRPPQGSGSARAPPRPPCGQCGTGAGPPRPGLTAAPAPQRKGPDRGRNGGGGGDNTRRPCGCGGGPPPAYRAGRPRRRPYLVGGPDGRRGRGGGRGEGGEEAMRLRGAISPRRAPSRTSSGIRRRPTAIPRNAGAQGMVLHRPASPSCHHEEAEETRTLVTRGGCGGGWDVHDAHRGQWAPGAHPRPRARHRSTAGGATE